MADTGSGSSIIGAASAVITTVGGIVIASNDAKERRKIEESLTKLSLAQQKELAEKQLAATDDIEKMRILYQYLAVVKNNASLVELDKKKYTGIIVLGVGLTVLGIVIIVARKK